MKKNEPCKLPLISSHFERNATSRDPTRSRPACSVLAMVAMGTDARAKCELAMKGIANYKRTYFLGDTLIGDGHMSLEMGKRGRGGGGVVTGSEIP